MSYTTIGKLIEQARREKRGMTREKLSKGICSPQMLYQIEKDQCDADVLMVDLLLQRAGKAPNKLERVLKSEMYHMVRIRDLLQRAILKNKRDLSKFNNLETFVYLGEDGDALYNELWKEVKSN